MTSHFVQFHRPMVGGGKGEIARASMLHNPNGHNASLLAPKIFHPMRIAKAMQPARINGIKLTDHRLCVACMWKDRAFGGFQLIGMLLAPFIHFLRRTNVQLKCGA